MMKLGRYGKRDDETLKAWQCRIHVAYNSYSNQDVDPKTLEDYEKLAKVVLLIEGDDEDQAEYEVE